MSGLRKGVWKMSISTKTKYERILSGDTTIYTRELSGFVGADIASLPSDVSERRMSYTCNLWRDYGADSSGAVETVPGFRKVLTGLGGKIYGLFSFNGEDGTEMLVVHSKNKLFRIPVAELENIGSALEQYIVCDNMAERRSSAFERSGRLYILDGNAYSELGADGSLKRVEDSGYVPVTFLNGSPYEARNMLSERFINRYTEKGVAVSSDDSYGWTYEKVISSDGSAYARITGIDCAPETMKYAYIPRMVQLSGESGRFSVLGYNDGVFSQLTETVQLVCDAKISFSRFSLGGMIKLERVVLRNTGASFAFDACQTLDEDHRSYDSAPLKELWIASENLAYNGVSTGYSSAECGICSAAERVTLYTAVNGEIWWNSDEQKAWDPTKTDTVYGVVFSNELTGAVCRFEDVKHAEYFNADGAGGISKLEYSAVSGRCDVHFSEEFAYTYCSLKLKYTDGTSGTYCFMLSDGANGHTNDEHGKRYVYEILDPISDKNSVSGAYVNGSTREYTVSDDLATVEVTMFPDDIGKALDICGVSGYTTLSEIDGIANVYEGCALSEKIPVNQLINNCTITCCFDGKVFFTGNPRLPNTVFYSSSASNGAELPAYVGVYNYFNDGIDRVSNNALLGVGATLAVFKSDVSSGATEYYHIAKDSKDGALFHLKPKYYLVDSQMSGIPCLGEACDFYGDAVFLSHDGLQCISKKSVNLERSVEDRSRRLGGALSKAQAMTEWMGYLCILGDNGEMYLADSRAVSENASTGEKQYEWFLFDGIGVWVNDHNRAEYSQCGYISAVCSETEETETLELAYGASVEIASGTFPEHPELNGARLQLLKGSGEVNVDSEIYSIPSFYYCGKLYAPTCKDGLVCALVKSSSGTYSLCPVEFSDERIGGEFSPACILLEYKGCMYFGTESGDVCIFNTDKRGAETDGFAVDERVIHSRWYDRCGHRYTSGFSTLLDNCGYMGLTKSTVGRSLVIKAKRLMNSSFTLRARSDREDWREIESFTASDNSFYNVDLGNFSFGSGESQLFVSREKLKKWCEKQLYLYSDGFRRPFGIYSIAYCYNVSGKVR